MKKWLYNVERKRSVFDKSHFDFIRELCYYD